MRLGGRGYHLSIWNDASADDQTVRSTYTATSPKQRIFEVGLDKASYDGGERNLQKVSVQMKGFLTPPYTGNFKLMLKADDIGKFFLSQSGMSANDMVSEPL